MSQEDRGLDRQSLVGPHLKVGCMVLLHHNHLEDLGISASCIHPHQGGMHRNRGTSTGHCSTTCWTALQIPKASPGGTCSHPWTRLTNALWHLYIDSESHEIYSKICWLTTEAKESQAL
eukprot:7506595-Ditylum_brightwellii.AAC.1